MPSLSALHPPLSLKSPAEKWAFVCLTGSVSLSLVSIAASQILLAGSLASALWLYRKGEVARRLKAPIMRPLYAYILWTAAAALLSSSTGEGLRLFSTMKKFYIFSLLMLVPMLAREADRLIWIFHAVFAVSAVSSAAGIIQYIIDPDRDELHRITGFMSQWMTYAGLLMLVLVALAAFTVSIRGRRWWIPVLGVLLSASIYLSETRNAWLGAVAGLIVIFALMRPRALAALPVILIAIYLVSPSGIQQRLRAGWNPEDPNTRNRIELFGTSLRLIGDNPWFGVGPQSVGKSALRYRGDFDFPDWMYQHMHNNFLQIASERGIPGLIIWLWFMLQLGWENWKIFRSSRSGSGEHRAAALLASTAALGAWSALLVSGMFEYNFGDSEVLALFLFLVSAPSAAAQAGGEPAAEAAAK